MARGLRVDDFQEYLFEYDFWGETYCFTIPAMSRAEAEQRIAALADSARWLGVVAGLDDANNEHLSGSQEG